MEQQPNVKSMTEGGLLSAITVIMALIAVYMPVVGTVAMLLWPLPIVILVVRHGMRWGLISSLATAIIMSILIEPVTAIRMVVAFAPPALVLGFGFRKKWAASRTLFISLVAAVISMLAGMAMLFAITSVNPFTLEVSMLRESMDTSTEIYQSMGMNEASLNESREQLETAFGFVEKLMPLIILSSSLIITSLNFVMASRLLRRLGHEVTSLPNFDDWHFSKLFLYLLGFSLVAIYWGISRDIDVLYMAGLNGYALATFAGFLQGLSLLSYYTRGRLPRFFFWLLAAMAFLNGLFAQVIGFMGLIDIAFNYRKRYMRKPIKK